LKLVVDGGLTWNLIWECCEGYYVENRIDIEDFGIIKLCWKL